VGAWSQKDSVSTGLGFKKAWFQRDSDSNETESAGPWTCLPEPLRMPPHYAAITPPSSRHYAAITPPLCRSFHRQTAITPLSPTPVTARPLSQRRVSRPGTPGTASPSLSLSLSPCVSISVSVSLSISPSLSLSPA
jgi:hypothetical protein